MERRIQTQLYFPLLLLLTFLFICPNPAPAVTGNKDKIIATIDGKPVYFHEIKGDVVSQELIFWSKKGRKPTSKEDHEEIKKALQKNREVWLRNVIEQKIRDRWIKDQKIEVTENDLDEFWEPFRLEHEKMSKETRATSLKAYQDSQKFQWNTVKAVYEDKMDRDKAFDEYNQNMAHKLPRAHWELMIHSYKEKWKRDLLKFQTSITYEEFLKQDRNGYRLHVHFMKTKARVHEVLAQKDQEVKEWLEKNPLNLKFKSVEELNDKLFLNPVDPMAEKRYLFWRNMYRQAEIKILDPNFKQVLTYIREEFPPLQ